LAKLQLSVAMGDYDRTRALLDGSVQIDGVDRLHCDYWSYGVAANRRTLEAFVRHHHSQGLSARLMSVDEIFHSATYESFKI
jgi:hypothetical protein